MWQRVIDNEENEQLIHCKILRRYKERNGGEKVGQVKPIFSSVEGETGAGGAQAG